jgi:ribosome-associated translation inhibitor RaiA
MSTQTVDDGTNWSAEIARIDARIEALKAWIEQVCLLQRANVDAQIAAVRADLKRLKSEVAALYPGPYAVRVAAQIQDMKAKGDAAYERLQAQLAAGKTVAP